MLKDRYGNSLTTESDAARDAYIDGVDKFLSGNAGSEEAFRRAVEADPNLAVAHVGIARYRILMADRPGAAAAIQDARNATGQSEREVSHTEAFGRLIDGDGPGGYKAIRAHVVEYPRDVMIAQTCTSVFGLIGFSGREGREAEQLAYTTYIAPDYGDDWWFLGQHAFAQAEVGQLELARENIERALEAYPRNGHNAHINAHIFYEEGNNDAGFDYLREWYVDYDDNAYLHCHISWHVALWTAAAGDMDTAWRLLEEGCSPENSKGPGLNILTDTVSFLHRAQLSGIDVPAERWKRISDFAAETFPRAGLAFADVHSGLAHAMAGNAEAFAALTKEAKGPAAEIVAPTWAGFKAFAEGDWAAAERELGPAMAGHERLGGSNAQRDLLEFTLAEAIRKQGRAAEADRLIAMRRPRQQELAAA
ncbi:MAG: tetratricopeptide repeat protein 38 family protein [Rhodospirillaceae bacterium]|nr:tetratricopeptide repeat protein 38 family protein [Rhodospirillaceae bacterium]